MTWLAWMLLACAGGAPAPAPAPVPVPAPTPAAPAPADAPPEEPMPVPDLPDDAVLQVFVPASGYQLRVWSDGHATRGGETLQAYATKLQRPEGRARFAGQVEESFGAALKAVDGQELGPFVEDGAAMPNHRTVAITPIVFRARHEGAVVEATVRGDLRLSTSLGPLQEPWDAMSRQLFPPDR